MRSPLKARWLGVAIAAIVGMSLVGCWKTKRNPLYCDGAELRCEDPALPFCDMVLHECVASAPDGSVGDDMEVPDLAPMCTGNAMCTSPTEPVCKAGTCSKCAAPADCTTITGKPVCAPSGACAECVAASDCAAVGKACNTTTNTCVACKANSECASGACRADGVCAQATDIVYVDNKNPNCPGMRAGTSADPFCQVAEALNSPLSTIFVVGSGTEYNAIAVTTALDKHIVGPGRDAATQAKFSQAALPALEVSPSAGTAKLSAAGIVLIGAVATPKPGLRCVPSGSGVAQVSVVRSVIRDSGGTAVESSNCALTLDADDIYNNSLGGIAIAGSTYTISNSLIWHNGHGINPTTPGLRLDSAATGLAAFNTIADNRYVGNPSGVDCGGAAHAIVASIVVQNIAPAGTQFAGTCTFTDVVVGTTETAANTSKLDPAFVSTSNFRLDMTAGTAKTANEACCVNKLTTGTTDHDVDHNPRPRPAGGNWDIGAFEAP